MTQLDLIEFLARPQPKAPGPDSQCADILAYLRTGAKLTPLEALDRFGCFRLGARIWDLKRAGHPIDKRMIEVESGKHVAEYWLASNGRAA